MGFGGGTGGGGTAKGGYGAPQSQNVQGWNQGGWGGRPTLNQADQDIFRTGINSLFGLNAAASQPAQAPVPEAANTIPTGGSQPVIAPPQPAAASPMDYFGGMSQEGRQQMADAFFSRFNRPQRPYSGGNPGMYGGVASMYGQQIMPPTQQQMMQQRQMMQQQQMAQQAPMGGGIAWTPQAQSAYQSTNLPAVTAQDRYTPPVQANVAQPYQSPAPANSGGGNAYGPGSAGYGRQPYESYGPPGRPGTAQYRRWVVDRAGSR